MKKAAVTNAQQAFDRAKELLKTAAGTQKTFDDAEAALRQAKANLEASQTRLDAPQGVQPAPTAPSSRSITGRAKPCRPGRPVVALLPPGNLKIRFFAPQAELPTIKYGETVAVSCDGCDKGLTAKVSFIARSAEYTPPVIYSLEERAKLVFLIEARPDNPEKFRVGQPVSVTLADGAPPVNNADIVIDVHRSDQEVRRPRGGARSLDAGQARHHLRLSRPQRLRQDHHHPHAVRPAHARRAATAPASATTSAPRPTRSSARSAT